MSSFISSLFKSELSLSFSEDVITTKIPKIPKAIEEDVNNLVAIFCIISVYQLVIRTKRTIEAVIAAKI